MPTTTAEHKALAKQYKDQAAQYTKVAEHKAMAAAYAKAHPDSKGGVQELVQREDAEALDMAAEIEKLAADAEKAADFHRRGAVAKELQGK